MVTSLKKQVMRVVLLSVCVAALTFALFLVTKKPAWLYQDYTRIKAQRQLILETQRAEELLKADTWGGETPEETFAMFLNALRAGDLDLASKYFVIEKQGEWRESLIHVRAGGQITSMISDLSTAEFYKTEGNLAWFNFKGTSKEGGIVDSQFTLIKNIKSGKWKISQL